MRFDFSCHGLSCPFPKFSLVLNQRLIHICIKALGEPELMSKYANGDDSDSEVVVEEEEEQEQEEEQQQQQRVHDSFQFETVSVHAEKSDTPVASHIPSGKPSKAQTRYHENTMHDVHDDISDDGELEETNYESQIIVSYTESSKPNEVIQLEKASEDLSCAVAEGEDALQGALALTDQAVKSVMAVGLSSSRKETERSSGRASIPQKENEKNGTCRKPSSSKVSSASDGASGKKTSVGILAGARPSSKADAVRFDDSESDSLHEESQDQKRIALPTAHVQPLPNFKQNCPAPVEKVRGAKVRCIILLAHYTKFWENFLCFVVPKFTS